VGLIYVAPRHYHIDNQTPDWPMWAPDRSFDGLTVAIIGGGPGIADLDLDVLRGHRFIVVNSACRKVTSAATEDDFLLFQDNAWAERYEDLIRGWPGVAVTTNRHAKARLGDLVRRFDVLVLTEWIGAAPDHAMASSGHVAACLAAKMGARRIVLVGFECAAVDGRTHGHADYQMHDLAPFGERFLPGWRGLAQAFDRRGVEVINSTPGSAIAEFRFVELSEALRWRKC